MSAEEFDFQSPAVHWMARTSSLNGRCCRIPYQCLRSLNALPAFSEKAFFFTDWCFVTSPSPNPVPNHCGQIHYRSFLIRGLDFLIFFTVTVTVFILESLGFLYTTFFLRKFSVEKESCVPILLRVFQTCLSWSAFRVSQRYRTRCHAGTVSQAPRMPKNKSKEAYLVPAPRHVCIARFLLQSASQGVQRDNTRDSPFLPEKALKTYLVPGWKARLSARHVWKMQIYMTGTVTVAVFIPWHFICIAVTILAVAKKNIPGI